MKRYASYIRVSTQKQGMSGLGLEAQRSALSSYVVEKEFLEIETASGKRHRPQLAACLEYCKKNDCVFLVAKLDRLSRNVRMLSELLDSGVAFEFGDMPNADRFMVQILACVAEKELASTSQRTKAALRAAKARGQRLGTHREGAHRFNDEHRRAGADANKANAVPQERDLVYILDKRSKGMSLRAIAAAINSQLGPEQAKWSVMRVQRVLKRTEVA